MPVDFSPSDSISPYPRCRLGCNNLEMLYHSNFSIEISEIYDNCEAIRRF